ncbi:hypothetical protein GCM10022243_25480 [Saccharothrix violaceirubra]
MLSRHPLYHEFRCCPVPVRRKLSPPGDCCRLVVTHKPALRPRSHPTDLTDEQWAVVDALLPDPPWLAGQGGRPE